MKKGFTLIELLAVIVILSIIALIATPIVMNIIADSKKGAAERGAENYVKAVETAVINKRMGNDKVQDGEYDIMADGNVCLKYSEANCTKPLSIDMSGTKPSSGTVKITNGKVDIGTVMTMGTYPDSISYYENGKCEVGDFGTIEIGTKVYYNPVLNQKSSATGDAECTGDCRIFYILEDKGKAYPTISLIMDRNLGDAVAWLSKDDYIIASGKTESDYLKFESEDFLDFYGPITANNYVKQQTSNWNVIVALPTCNQFSKLITNEKPTIPSWANSNNDDYWLNCLSNKLPCKLSSGGWLGNYPTGKITEQFNEQTYELEIKYDNSKSEYIFVRPVITILKSKLNS